uniref:Uncharacterized protein n=1 Tax=Trypanosoma vivax (strain Y486) TaxID=1055687 RepID=G0UC26_TRYVY|nr:hypothetical protein, unlikely [Trypanosoma vivax Y486]
MIRLFDVLGVLIISLPKKPSATAPTAASTWHHERVVKSRNMWISWGGSTRCVPLLSYKKTLQEQAAFLLLCLCFILIFYFSTVSHTHGSRPAHEHVYKKMR